MRSKRKITILTFTVLVVFLVSFSCVSVATYQQTKHLLLDVPVLVIMMLLYIMLDFGLIQKMMIK